MTMTLAQLLADLEEQLENGVDPETPVLIAVQPNWPLCSISRDWRPSTPARTSRRPARVSRSPLAGSATGRRPIRPRKRLGHRTLEECYARS